MYESINLTETEKNILNHWYKQHQTVITPFLQNLEETQGLAEWMNVVAQETDENARRVMLDEIFNHTTRQALKESVRFCKEELQEIATEILKWFIPSYLNSRSVC